MHPPVSAPDSDETPSASRTAPTPEVRARLVDALAAVIDEHGYGPSRVRDIARTARVSLTTFYLAYASKEECAVELAGRLERQTEAWLIDRAAATVAGSWETSADATIQAALLTALGRPALTYAILVELGGLAGPGRRARRDGLAALAAAVARSVEDVRAAAGTPGSRRLDGDEAAFVVGGLVEGLVDLVVDGHTGSAAQARVRELAAVTTAVIARLTD